MRLSSTSLLLVGAIAAGAAMFNCSAADSSPDEIAATDDAITGLGNKLGLRLVYDQKSSSVRATLRRSLGRSEQLRLQVRRGRLSSRSQSELDCNRLPAAPAIAPTFESGLALYGAATQGFVTYQGPAVDPSYLATVYDEQWILNHVTPKMLEELQTQGADSIVEACVVEGSTIRARVQTSIAYAWDQADPLLAYHTSADPSLYIATNHDPIAATNRPSGALGRPIRSMEKYAELCVEELGDIPFFPKKEDGTYDTFDCRDFTTGSGQSIPGLEANAVPQSQHDAAGHDTTPKECDDAKPGSANCWKTCDRPDWRSQTCEPGPTVAAAQNERGTQWVLLCRSPGEHTDSLAVRNSTKTFNDIAMIGHNPKTGKTCFFQNKLHVGNDGEHVTHPADLERSRDIWDNPQGYCTGCHSADAFIHSPWIDGATRNDGSPVVPMMGKHPDFEISWLAAPYSVVNRQAMADAKIGNADWPKPKQLISEEASACIACHRIGNGDGMKRFPMWSAGEEGLASTRVSGTYDGRIAHRYSPKGATFESTHWMPPRLGGLTAETWAGSPFAKAVAHIKTCAQNENDPSCLWADVPEK